MLNQWVAFLPLPHKRRDNLVNKLLQLGNLVGASKAYTQIGHTGGLKAVRAHSDLHL